MSGERTHMISKSVQPVYVRGSTYLVTIDLWQTVLRIIECSYWNCYCLFDDDDGDGIPYVIVHNLSAKYHMEPVRTHYRQSAESNGTKLRWRNLLI